MNNHDILLTVQYITITVLFAELLIVFMKWKNAIHSCLFLACAASFISNLGYLFEMQAQSGEAYLSALKLSYAGRVWIVFAFFLFSARLCGKKIPRWLVLLLVLLHTGIYVSIMMIGKNDLYYPSYQFITDPEFPRFYHTNGVMHDLLFGLNAVFILVAMTWVIREFLKTKGRTPRLRLFMLILAYGVQSVFFALQASGVLEISKYYDLTMAGTLFGTIFILIGILGFDLLGAREIARDFAIDRISEGVIAVGNDGRIQYYNEPAAKLFPEFSAFYTGKPGSGSAPFGLRRTPYDILSLITDAVRNGETLKIGERIYTPEENDLVYQGES